MSDSSSESLLKISEVRIWMYLSLNFVFLDNDSESAELHSEQEDYTTQQGELAFSLTCVAAQ